MKKILTILGVIGLSATTGITVVSCTTKKVEIVFNDLTSVNTETWIGTIFGGFYDSDFKETTIDGKNVMVIDNKAKIAAYVAASFKNYDKAYQKIIAEGTNIIIYYYNELTEGYSFWNQSVSPTKQLFFQLSDSTFKKSNYLKFSYNQDQDNEKKFDFNNWIQKGENQNKTIEIEKIEKELKSEDLQIMQNLRRKIVSDWKELKNGALWPLVDVIINDVFNYLGEYLIRYEGFYSDYEELPITIKQQFKNALNQQENREGKDQTRKSVYEEWPKIDFPNEQLLPVKIKFLDQLITINLDFKTQNS